MNTALEYSTRVVQEGGRRCKKSTLNDLVHLTPIRIPLMNPPVVLLVCLHWLINYIDTAVKCHLKILTFKGTLRQVLIRVYLRIDWKYSQSESCWYFRPSFVNCCPSNLLSGSTDNYAQLHMNIDSDLLQSSTFAAISVSCIGVAIAPPPHPCRKRLHFRLLGWQINAKIFYVPETHIMYFIRRCWFLKCSEEIV